MGEVQKCGWGWGGGEGVVECRKSRIDIIRAHPRAAVSSSSGAIEFPQTEKEERISSFSLSRKLAELTGRLQSSASVAVQIYSDRLLSAPARGVGSAVL